ncbi:mitochondrial ribonuclease P protein 1 homolog [Mizuhopecten yessoensis]|uniref:RNA (guanine-9-)-methyltransferase domain-containing protein 1 n=1 Tax=Mizuhopecten yessoensis TaxID=6573 RepID=A0A210PH29_MIZYE|nr:mitochondrial ribonuclease P protein 1 homolog [Mizuhopecten yessoensis]XP_021341832.1 mitochondrial ribonuclease P protein 1 homolog [Mizuhopecten yessoensis]OWF35792.1 Mitochondrial ribonuclease P protein 1-like [Mizuhopecten yessoensis]
MSVLGVGLRRIVRPVSVMRRCWSGAKIVCPSRYTVKRTHVPSSLCRHLCDQRSPEHLEVMTNEEQEESCPTEQEDVEDPEKPPKSLPLPSQEFLDLLNDRQLDHYKTILDKYENFWRIKFDDVKVPSVLKDSNWRFILGFGTSKTLQVLRMLHSREAKKKLKRETKPKEKNQNVIMHSHTLPNKSSQKAYDILKTYKAMEYGQQLVFDLGFKIDAEVTHIFREERRIKKQINQIIHDNARQRFPFHLVFCNVNEQTRSMLEEAAGDIPITITDQCYLSMFSRKDLVYLSPDAATELETYNHNCVYLVGCITDLETKPLTKSKAQKQGLKHMSFPIRRYLGNIKSRILTLDQVANVLHDLKDTGDWMTALKHVPKRFRQTENNSSSMKKKKKMI